MKKRVEIVCSACGKDALIRREPVYEGFRKTGERLSCASCGHGYASEEEVPFKSSGGPRLFTDEDKSRTPRIFRDGKGSRTCGHCRHYVVNPFTQRCGLQMKRVEATDFCDQFEVKPPAGPAGGQPPGNDSKP